MAAKIGGYLSGKFWGMWYPFVTKTMEDTSLVFMNYGYNHADLSPDTLPLEAKDEGDRFFAQLYYHVASFVDMQEKKVLEVSSGHGGGASFITRYLKPASYTGLERNPKAVAFSTKRHNLPKLSFVEGDAQDINFPDESFDVVVNVEASHSYAAPEKFFAEVKRVLKKGGHFLTTDFRNHDKYPAWRDQLVGSGLKLEKETDITQNVLESLVQITDKRMSIINSRVPKLLHGFSRHFAGVEGSPIFEDFKSGKRIYATFALRKE